MSNESSLIKTEYDCIPKLLRSYENLWIHKGQEVNLELSD